jgi:hypothetical protein
VVHAPPVPKVPKQVIPGDVRAAIEKVRSADFSYAVAFHVNASGVDGKRSALSAAVDELIAATDKAMTAMVGPKAGLGPLQDARRRLIDQADGTDAKLFVGVAAYAVIATRQGKKVPNPVTVSDQLSGNPAGHQSWDAIEPAARTATDADRAFIRASVAVEEAQRTTGGDVPKAKAELTQKLQDSIHARNELRLVILASGFSADDIGKHFAIPRLDGLDIQNTVSNAVHGNAFGF